jgi:hypothetical protein
MIHAILLDNAHAKTCPALASTCPACFHFSNHRFLHAGAAPRAALCPSPLPRTVAADENV